MRREEGFACGFVSLAGVRDLEFELTEEEKPDLDSQFERVLRELKKRADVVKGRVLVVLDNVDQAAAGTRANPAIATGRLAALDRDDPLG